ncbi:Cytochrome P474 monooxygenase [Paramyrothecium foliicola]|nr:Cytochrome P474 monooxygenase [Paramyrothecium foliicola]
MERLAERLVLMWRAPLLSLGFAVLLLAISYSLWHVFYNLYVHPLRRFPGPYATRASLLCKLTKSYNGNFAHYVNKLHEKYGPVVRIAPNELSFIDSKAWKDIYGHHSSHEMTKDPHTYRPLGDLVPDSLITSSRHEHAAIRRQLSHGFSERSMRGQEPIINSYVDLLIRRLEEHSDNGWKPIDMRAWFIFTSFDIIGNLAFGSDFGCLEYSRFHPWVHSIANNFRESEKWRYLSQVFPLSFITWMVRWGIFKSQTDLMLYTKQKVEERVNFGVERPDLIEGLIRKRDILKPGELEMNAQLIIVGGSDTTATLLTGALFLIASHPEVYTRLTKEIRTAFKDEKDITLTSIKNLDYMLACLKESLRMYPPAALGLGRVVPKGGTDIAGYYVPQDASVAVWPLAAYWSHSNFKDPGNFHPSRFLGDKEFASDDLDALQPFSTGPRNCIGRNMAYAEMRLIMARLLFKFDVELLPETKDWIKRQKVFTVWEKPELPVYLRPVSSH